jgi:AcrR family transcriptional regulator
MTATERDTGEAILRAAADLFAERGYKGTTTRAIAERAGVNEVTVFRRFGNKQGVLTALGEMWAGRMAGFAVAEIPDPADTRATLRSLAALEVLQAREFGGVALRLALDAATNPEVAAVMGGGPGQNFAGLVAYLAQRQKAGDLRPDMDPRVMAEAFFALTSQTVMSRQALGGVTTYELSVDEAADQLFELYMDGISIRSGS